MAFTKEGTGSRRYMVMPMKTSHATTISIAGVVAAGAFTFAVNSSMLSSVSTSAEIPPIDAAVLVEGSSELSAVATPDVVGATGPGVESQSLPKDRSAPTSSSSPSAIPAVSPTTTVQVGASTVSSYSIQGAASVQLVQTPNHLSVAGVKPQDGYIFSAENVSPTRVIVTLTNSSNRLKFNAEIIGGRVVTSLISSDVISAAPVAATPSNTTPRRSKAESKESRNKRESRNKKESRNKQNDEEREEREEREEEDDD